MQNNISNKLNILIFYDDYACNTSTVIEHLESFKQYSRHNIFYAIGTKEAICNQNINFADVIIIHYSVRISLPQYISPYVVKEIRNFKGLKLLFLQDEYENTHQAHYWIKQLEVNKVFTCVPLKFIHDVYPKDMFKDVVFVNNLTGYVPENIPNLKITPIEQRKNIIVYRGRKLDYWYGSLGQEKYTIGIKMKKICQQLNLSEDIECDDDKRIYGSEWYDFLLSGRAMLGTESGANIFDLDGSLKRSIKNYLQENPKVTYKKIKELFLQNDGKIIMNQISPKIFQSILCRTALILYEGDYSGILVPEKHYIPLRKDWKNIKEVIESLKNLDCMNKLVENSYNDIVKSKKYTYQSFILEVEKEIEYYCITPKRTRVVVLPYVSNNTNEVDGLLSKPYIYLDYLQSRNQMDIDMRFLKDSFLNTNLLSINPYTKVVNSSVTYQGHELTKIIDIMDKDFYASVIVDTPFPHFVEFVFCIPMIIGSIEIEWNSDQDYASDYIFEHWDNVQNKYIEIPCRKVLSGQWHYLTVISDKQSLKKIRLIVNQTLGQPRLLIKKINFFSSIGSVLSILADNNVDKPFNIRNFIKTIF